MTARRGPARRKARVWVRWTVTWMGSGLSTAVFRTKTLARPRADLLDGEVIKVRIVEVLPARSRK